AARKDLAQSFRLWRSSTDSSAPAGAGPLILSLSHKGRGDSAWSPCDKSHDGGTALLAMTAITSESRPTDRAIGWLQVQLPKIVLSPSLAAVLVFVYGFILWTVFLSFSRSKMLPVYKFAGLDAYEKLWSQPNWYIALENLGIYGLLYIGLCIVVGLLLAILLDQRIRIEGVLRPIYLYPMALSFIVTGTAWKWFLNP